MTTRTRGDEVTRPRPDDSGGAAAAGWAGWLAGGLTVAHADTIHRSSSLGATETLQLVVAAGTAHVSRRARYVAWHFHQPDPWQGGTQTHHHQHWQRAHGGQNIDLPDARRGGACSARQVTSASPFRQPTASLWSALGWSRRWD